MKRILNLLFLLVVPIIVCAAVSITPEQTCDYLIEISAYSYESGYDVGHYGLIIAHD